MIKNRFKNNMKRNKHQKGMGLLEVVVSMLVIGLGMTMSIAMIQTSVKNSISALNQNTARTLMESISDRMRINRYAAEAYRYGNTASGKWTKPTASSLESSNPPPTAASCIYCSGKQLADRKKAYNQGYSDAVNWAANVANSLPEGESAIERDGNQYKITVRWQNITSDPNGLESATAKAPPQEASLVFTL